MMAVMNKNQKIPKPCRLIAGRVFCVMPELKNQKRSSVSESFVLPPDVSEANLEGEKGSSAKQSFLRWSRCKRPSRPRERRRGGRSPCRVCKLPHASAEQSVLSYSMLLTKLNTWITLKGLNPRRVKLYRKGEF